MAINYPVNKVSFGSTPLIDVSDATVAESQLTPSASYGLSTGTSADILKNKTAYGKSGVKLTGTCPYNADTTSATISGPGELLNGVIAFNAAGNAVTGQMANHGSANITVSTSAGTTIPQGYYDGTGKAVVDSTTLANLTPSNIRDGVTILNVTGNYTGAATPTSTQLTVTPLASWASDQTYSPATYNKDYFSQVTVTKIATTSAITSGTSGYTITIGA